MLAFNRCMICQWRRARIVSLDPHEDDETDAPPDCCDSCAPEILRLLHTHPGDVWVAIINTCLLSRPDGVPIQREGSSRWWVRMPLRLGTRVMPVLGEYMFEGKTYSRYEPVVAYHNTQLKHLVSGTKEGIGNGILKDRRLRYGRLSHGTCIGVNVYGDGGLETFEGHTGWIQLEVLCTGTTKLKRGRADRYCVKGPTNGICDNVSIRALWVPYDELPPLVFLS